MLKSTLRGFTIIELAISVAVLSVVASIFAPVIGQGIDAILITRSKEQLAQEAHLAMSWITEDLKNNCAEITGLTSTAIACDKPNSGSFDYFTWSPSGILQLDRINNGVTQALVVKPIRFFQVKGYRAVGSVPNDEIPNDYWGDWPNFPDFAITDVKIVQIYLSVGDEQNHYELMTAIHPRLIP
jgi:prepilin-type N-terminal cleavage/methylation domain-containing protein